MRRPHNVLKAGVVTWQPHEKTYLLSNPWSLWVLPNTAKDVIQLRISRGRYSRRTRWAPHARTCVLRREKQREVSHQHTRAHTCRRWYRGGAGRDLKMLLLKFRVTDTSKALRTAGRSWKRQGTDSALELMERTQPCQHVAFSPVIQTSDFQPPEMWEERQATEFVAICYGSHRKLVKRPGGVLLRINSFKMLNATFSKPGWPWHLFPHKHYWYPNGTHIICNPFWKMLLEGNLLLITRATTAHQGTELLLANVLTKHEPGSCPANSVV